MKNILIILPLKPEYTLFLRSCAKLGYTAEKHDNTYRLSVQHIPTLNASIALGGHGKTQFGIHTQYFIDRLSPLDLVICIGAAGALTNNLRIGDIVIGTSIIEHDYTERFKKRPLPLFRTHPAIIDSFRKCSFQNDTFKMHFGPIASGDEDITEVVRKDILHQKTQAIAVAWEGAGGARACIFNKIPYVELRSITDSADGLAVPDFKSNLATAIDNAVELIVHWIHSFKPHSL